MTKFAETSELKRLIDDVLYEGVIANADNALMRADGTDGKIQGSSVILDDNGAFTEVRSVKGEGGQDLVLAGGLTAATSNGEDVVVRGGTGGATSGDGGDAIVRGGSPPTSGHGGSVNILGRNGIGTNKDGGNVNITAGNKTCSGTNGIIKCNDILDMVAGNITLSGGGTVDGRDVAADGVTLDALPFTVTAIKTAAYTANDRELVRVDPS